MDKNIRYIENNFIEWNKLCEKTKISSEELELLIKNKWISKPSYTIQTKTNISSSLEDNHVISETKKYFPKSTVALILNNNKIESQSSFKNSIKADFIEEFKKNEDQKYAYNNILKENDSIDIEKLNAAFEMEWQHYLNGIYGICTLNATGSEIAKKEIAVKKLIAFNNEKGNKKLNENDKKELIKLNNNFNKVSNLFAPYQREASSRGKYLDKLLKSNSLNQFIKKYS